MYSNHGVGGIGLPLQNTYDFMCFCLFYLFFLSLECRKHRTQRVFMYESIVDKRLLNVSMLFRLGFLVKYDGKTFNVQSLFIGHSTTQGCIRECKV